ncbi:MAG: hypothetical protein GVY22_09275, partial [Gammaproteobacteria bacterium]|nr:hypothetical protein [Gammaproteobacteria bacterium]
FRDYLINTNLSPTDQPAADLPVIKPLRFNAKAVKDWINAKEPDHAAQP